MKVSLSQMPHRRDGSFCNSDGTRIEVSCGFQNMTEQTLFMANIQRLEHERATLDVRWHRKSFRKGSVRGLGGSAEVGVHREVEKPGSSGSERV